jgi:PGF-pre-PGF domain-containing protein/uncharacterized repeat protein (TIGR02543 family)
MTHRKEICKNIIFAFIISMTIMVILAPMNALAIGATTYYVHYNGNGNTGGSAPTTQSFTSGGVTISDQGTLVRTGYSFTGWNTASGGSGTAYSPGSTYFTSADVTLYAQWTLLPYSGGSGTSDDPYLLSTDSDIDTLSTTSADWGKNFTLTQNITLVGNHTPIGNSGTQFTGDFDGDGYTISNLTIYETTNYVGFFGYIGDGADIHDLEVETSQDGVVSTMYNVGILVGQTDNIGTNISNCSVTGNVTGGSNVGGLVGVAGWYSEIINCSATVNVTATSDTATGGLIGCSFATVSNCSATGTVTGAAGYGYVGGLIGDISEGDISNCFAAVDVTGSGNYVGGFAGMLESGDTVSNCSATGNVTSSADHVGGLIGYAEYSEIIDCSATGNVTSSADHVGGLIGHAKYSEIIDCSATGSVTTTGGNNECVGGLIGYNNNGDISNCFATGAVTATSSGSNIGGLIGVISEGGISNCYATGDVTATDSATGLGGLIGCQSGGAVNNSYATGNITNNNDDYNYGDVGGLLAYQLSGTVNNCYATGTVSSTGDEVGGLIAYQSSSGIVNNCYATGTVNSTGDYVGGLIAYLAGTVDNSFATGTVAGIGFNVSGFIGFNDSGSIGNCYYSGSPADSYATLTSYDNFTSFAFVSGASGLNWNENSDIITRDYNLSFIWRIDDGSSLPYFQYVATSVNASNTSVTYNENDNMPVDPGIIVAGISTFTSAKVYIGDGYVENEDFLRFTNTSSINGIFDSLTGILSLSGSGNAADYQEAFRNVRYENIEDDPDTSNRNITFVLASNSVYLASTGHFYESISTGETPITWTDAKTAAEARSLSGMQGYLATILTAEESAFLESKAPDNAWIGATDVAVEGEWRWVTGPENVTGDGTLFYFQDNSTTLPGFYSNWNSGEPNDGQEGGEDYAQILGAGNKMWNDLANSNNVYYYLVEYGGMPNETAPQITATITVNINSINDAPAMPGNFTTPLAGDSVERGSTVNVSWGESTDQENDSIEYDLWYFNGTWGQVADMLNVTNYEFTIPIDDISEALFKVYANDSVASSSENNVTFNLTSVVPVANFTVNVTSGMVPQTVNFTDLSSNHPNGWVWDFGDGNTSSDQNPMHTYVSAGTYNISLNASNPAGSNISIQTGLITIIDTPVANFTSNVTVGAAPLTVSLTDTSDNDPVIWSWNFGDGNTSSAQDPTHTYVSAGTYNVSLNATNPAGSNVTTQTAYITVYITPVANFSADVTSGTAPLSVSFTDLSNNTPTSWLWDFGDGSNSTSQNPTHSYTVAGSYNVTLNATNAAGSNVSEQTSYITVAAAPSSSGSSGSSGTRASVSQGQNPAIVGTSASSVIRVTGGSPVEYDFSDSGTPVLGVSFDAKTDQGLVVAKVQVLSNAPEGVPSPSGHSYQMMSIDVGSEGTISSSSGSADNIQIRFKVSKQWIEENNIDISTIRMTRYHGEQWNDLPTYQEREDDEFIYFYAETPGFSIFEIVGDQLGTPVETSQIPAGSPVPVEEEEIPVEEESGFGFIYPILGIAAIVSIGYVLMQKKKGEGGL